ncbi:RagB/SusD family nutrient uptake outer membrane protein [Pedobacter aquatilis]|uniref:RagB/SusD family nutrient uptake outer membrane protein n=1 Tax=Pedobacter aquatilis TaxID=351343 RepID=UPI00293012D9|nr:RagB/SusD family nutrient uptake outer membrane protein [Pedobacter aquatilis]
MMKTHKNLWLLTLLTCTLLACKKDFLDQKPSSDILAPKTLTELQGILEAAERIAPTGALPQLSCDDYLIIADQNYNALITATQRNAYTWQKNLYEGEKVEDWNSPYQTIFYANSVLEVLAEQSYANPAEANRIKGWAYFVRAYAYYDMAKNFCKVYSPNAGNDLGLPLRKNASVDVIEKRASLEETFRFILSDLDASLPLLNPLVEPLNKSRPSKAASWAMKARVYLYMGDYRSAESSADSALRYHDKLIDFSTVNTSSDTPFSHNAAEVIYHSNQIGAYSSTTGTGNRPDIEVNPELYQSFAAEDLRKSIFFRTNTLGRINVKRGYMSAGIYQFSGLACDELYLIKAECLARRGETGLSLQCLNRLLSTRFKKTPNFQPLTAANAAEALNIILLERRKELIWRGIRWSDLKRLNREGAAITLIRFINGKTYTLSPNDARYAFPIPEQEINQSGIEQN